MVSIQPKTTREKSADKVQPEPAETVLTEFASQSDHDNLLTFQQSRNAQAFAVLVERHQGMVFGIAQRMLGCPHSAEDVVQATFLVLANSAKKIRKRHSLVSWLYGVAYRISARSLRQRAKVTVSTLKDEVMVSADPLEALNARFEQNAVFEELHRLRDDLRTPMVLRYLNGKSNLQVAEELDLSESAVEGRLKRARKQLRLRLAKKGVTFGIAIGLLAIVQREASAAVISTSATNIATASLASQALSGSGVETGISNEVINLAEQEIFKMASVKVATFVLFTSVALGFLASGWALAGDTFSSTDGSQHSNEVVINGADSEADAKQETAAILTQQEEAEEGIFTSDNPSTPTAASTTTANPTVPTSNAAPKTLAGYHSIDELAVSEIAIYDALKTPVRLDYFEQRLGDVIMEWNGDYEMQVIVDERALEALDVSVETQITLKVDDIRLDSAIKHMLQPIGATAIVSDEVLLITSIDRAEELTTTRVYKLPKYWRMDATSVEETIGISIDTDYWEMNGGTGTISALDGGLVITANHRIHSEINKLFSQLEKLYPNTSSR